MARERDEAKRKAILDEASRLFAERGFHATSVSDIVKGIDLPVGSVYTYFRNKDDIIRSAIEEGWSDFYDTLSSACAAESGPAARLDLIVNRYLPSLLEKTELIALILSEGLRFTDLNSKLERLAVLIGGVLQDLAAERGVPISLSPRQAVTALSVFFLGSLDTIRLSKQAGLPLRDSDVVSFIRFMVENAFHFRFDEMAGGASGRRQDGGQGPAR